MDVVTIGESMALFTPSTSGKMRYASTFSRKFGGAETNVAIGLHRLGFQTGWISKVGKDELGEALVNFIRGEGGVDVSQVKWDSKASTGLYLKELRSDQDVRVYYYRSGSAASRLTPEDIDESYIAQAKYLHITGITPPALSQTCYETVLHAIKIAKKHGVKVVFDPNIREKLWTSKQKARDVLLEIASRADIVLPGISEAKFFFGEKPLDEYANLFLENGSSVVIIKEGSKGSHFYTETENGFVPSFKVEHVVDPIGAGDGFAAGVIAGLLEELSLEKAIARANAIGAMVTMINGDVEGLPDQEEIDRFIQEEKEDVSR
ncbi:2-dehydro-3-deoxygluconate kinase [Gracilibacillus boraciitolerans JCM 21714]|uniref:2-dehydro-3-deoxygluconate kinase n=1 Tax=Gracilibacillus boraciitolerans JCM 21714 TaxID=1298598 RepID=W4VGA1_9BACI|nr:sugar kinase [Gracilibacillus boraciitolerans]GAE92237.1 2-dehydro-3-deoxygluconate kinase [Gracilibacillus boraciitolerans JCM 21714]